MSGSGTTFAKGGCGCLLIFLGLGFLAAITGGRVHLDLGGAIFLFIIGGFIALIYRGIFGKKEEEADYRMPDEERRDEYVPPMRASSGKTWNCSCCGNVNRDDDQVCLSCDWPRNGGGEDSQPHGYREIEDE